MSCLPDHEREKCVCWRVAANDSCVSAQMFADIRELTSLTALASFEGAAPGGAWNYNGSYDDGYIDPPKGALPPQTHVRLHTRPVVCARLPPLPRLSFPPCPQATHPPQPRCLPASLIRGVLGQFSACTVVDDTPGQSTATFKYFPHCPKFVTYENNLVFCANPSLIHCLLLGML
eukprot:2841082-Rhodomonas_salina.2